MSAARSKTVTSPRTPWRSRIRMPPSSCVPVRACFKPFLMESWKTTEGGGSGSSPRRGGRGEAAHCTPSARQQAQTAISAAVAPNGDLAAWTICVPRSRGDDVHEATDRCHRQDDGSN